MGQREPHTQVAVANPGEVQSPGLEKTGMASAPDGVAIGVVCSRTIRHPIIFVIHGRHIGPAAALEQPDPPRNLRCFGPADSEMAAPATARTADRVRDVSHWDGLWTTAWHIGR